jgi:hypothetical protein
MGFEIHSDLVIGVYGAKEPSNQEWSEYIEALKKIIDRHPPVLTVSDGGGPNAGQRQKLLSIYSKEHHEQIRIAVVSDATAVYGVVTAISWFNSSIKAFKISKLDEALSYLGVSSARTSIVLQSIRSLRRDLGLPLI